MVNKYFFWFRERSLTVANIYELWRNLASPGFARKKEIENHSKILIQFGINLQTIN
jgi:hypothetical protein